MLLIASEVRLNLRSGFCIFYIHSQFASVEIDTFLLLSTVIPLIFCSYYILVFVV